MEQSTPVTLTESQKNQLKNRANYYLDLAAKFDRGEIKSYRDSNPSLDMGYHAYQLAELVKSILDPAPVVEFEPEPAVIETGFEDDEDDSCEICGDSECQGLFDPELCPEFPGYEDDEEY